MIIRKGLKLSNIDYYKKHLEIINPVLPTKLTNKEIEVLATFMSFTGTIAQDRFGATAKKIVKDTVNLTSAGLSNYIKSMKNKGFISGKEILPILFPDMSEQEYNFKLINYDL